jgi:hypothetical protein
VVRVWRTLVIGLTILMAFLTAITLTLIWVLGRASRVVELQARGGERNVSGPSHLQAFLPRRMGQRGFAAFAFRPT